MGEIPVITEPHVKRSSSMAFALRWKHEHRRLIGTVLISMALTLMFFMLLNGTATKRVSVVVDGKETVLVTKSSSLQHLLDDNSIMVGENDRVSMPLGTKLKNGDAVVVNHTAPVQLTADGKTVTLYTTGKTVASALEDLNIQVGSQDKVSPAPDAGLDANSEIKIVRVKKEVAEQEVPIAFDTVTKNDSSILKGKQQVVQEGVEGSKVIKTEKVYEDGVLVSENKVDESVKTESVSKVVAVGTKAPAVTVLSSSSANTDQISKNGVQFGYKKVLNNVTLTAYSAGAASTGKDESSPQYGMTFSGTTATEGRTIAVDKNVIPIGWWVYIEGIGFRRAEDTGSAVNGNIIDVYYDSMSYANKFGTKRGVTVYVIGPKKPTAD